MRRAGKTQHGISVNAGGRVGKCWQILMACECAGIDGRMKTIIPRPVVNSPHCPAGFSFLFSFVCICFHLLFHYTGLIPVVLILFLLVL